MSVLTKEEVVRNHGGNESDWAQWHNGGGWVHKDAKVNGAYIGAAAVVLQGCSISGGTFHGGRFYRGNFLGGKFYSGRFYGGCYHDGIFRGGEYYGGSYYGGIFYGGEFLDGTFFDGFFHGGKYLGGTYRCGHFYDGVFHCTPLQIIGSRNVVTAAAPNKLSVGGELHTVDWWLENTWALTRMWGYEDSEIEEYVKYFELFKNSPWAFPEERHPFDASLRRVLTGNCATLFGGLAGDFEGVEKLIAYYEE